MTWAPTVSMALLAALVLGTLAKRCGLSPLLGYLLAGVVIGPHTPGFVGDAAIANQLADVGIVLLMFGVGIGFSFRDLMAVRRLAVPGALCASGTAVLLGFAVGRMLGWPVGGSAVLGMCLATASTVVIVRGMSELGLLSEAPGQIAVGWSLVEDLITVVLLVVLPALAPAAPGSTPPPVWQALLLSFAKVVMLAATVVFGGGLLVPRLLGVVARAESRELFTLAVLTIAIGIAYLAAEVFGVSVALGAFFAGMVVGRSDLSHQAAADSIPMRDAFAVSFFVAVGMLFDPSFVIDNPLPVAAALAVVLLLKPLAATVFLLVRGQATRLSLSVGGSVAQVSEFSFVLAGVATELGILPRGGHDLVLATALVSIAANPVLIRGFLRLDRRVAALPMVQRRRRRAAGGLDAVPPMATPLDGHIVVCGMGRVGAVLVEFLRERAVPFAVIDSNRSLVERLRADGTMALWGDAGSPVLLDRAGIDRCRALLLLIPDAVAQQLAIEHVRQVRSDLTVLARAHSRDHMASLQARGVHPFHGERELGFAMARELLELLGSSPIEAEAAVMSAARSPGQSVQAPRLFEIVIPDASVAVDRTLAELSLPQSVLVVAVVRQHDHLIARGGTRIGAGDTLLVFASAADAREVERCVGRAVADDPAGA